MVSACMLGLTLRNLYFAHAVYVFFLSDQYKKRGGFPNSIHCLVFIMGPHCVVG